MLPDSHSDTVARKPWFIYMLRCNDNTLYTGITCDSARRLREHNGELVNGARYTRPRRPVVLVYLESTADRGSAAKREAMLKSLKKIDKEALIHSEANQLHQHSAF